MRATSALPLQRAATACRAMRWQIFKEECIAGESLLVMLHSACLAVGTAELQS